MSGETRRLTWAGLGCMLLVGCAAGNTDLALGRVELEGPGVSGLTVDFGWVVAGRPLTRNVGLKNVGNGAFSLDAVEVVSGLVAVGAQPTGQPFLVRFVAQEVGVGGSGQLAITFDPLGSCRDEEFTARLDLRTGNTAQPTVAVTLTGRRVPCEEGIPRTLDFGGVAVGESLTLPLKIRNRAGVTQLADVGSLVGSPAFAIEAGSAAGEVQVPARGARDLVVRFTPTTEGSFTATLLLRPVGFNEAFTVTILGEGLREALEVEPSPLNLGFTAPGTAASGALALVNRGFSPVNVDVVGAFEGSMPSTIFVPLVQSVVVPAAQRDGPALVPGRVLVPLEFRPQSARRYLGNLRLTTDLAAQRSLLVGLEGTGGGPVLQVLPATAFALGRVALFTSPPSRAMRKLIIRNGAPVQSPADVRNNLRLSPTFARVVATSAAASADELCVGWVDPSSGLCQDALPPGYNRAGGLSAGEELELGVQLSPRRSGSKTFEVFLASNDPAFPEVRVTVTAEVEALNTCRVVARPAVLNFGMVSAPGFREQFVKVSNPGTSACIVGNLETEAGSAGSFQVMDSADFVLPPGGDRVVRVRFTPRALFTASVPQSGVLRFNVNDAVSPVVRIPLGGTLGTSCLITSPGNVNLGQTAVGCVSPERTVTLINTCPVDIDVLSVRVSEPAGFPPGMPPCQGSAPCPEFSISEQSQAVGVLVQATGQRTLGLRYRPRDLGPDNGALAVTVRQYGRQEEYVVPLQGEGGATGTNTERFLQSREQRSDTIIVVDDGPEMSQEQDLVKENLAPLTGILTQQRLDFQLAVLGSSDALDAGTFKLSPGGVRIFTPRTPGLAADFKETLGVGVGGVRRSECFRGVSRALSPALATGVNRNFLRADAFLSLLCVSDQDENGRDPLIRTIAELASLKNGRLDRVAINAIAGVPLAPQAPVLTRPPECEPFGAMNLPDAGASARYVEAAQLTDGTVAQICAQDWGDALSALSRSVAGVRDTYFLNGFPVGLRSPLITVNVAGIDLPQVDTGGRTVWRYDINTNSVELNILYLPQPGQVVSFTYDTECLL